MQLIEDFLIFKEKESATMAVASAAIAEAQEDLCRCTSLLLLLDSIK